jgi:tetratricopeptide (TPR) repeat protein
MRILATLGIVFALASPVWAEEATKMRAEQLDKLFGQLHETSAPADPNKIVDEIWALWAHNDSATAELLLRQGIAAMNAHEYGAAEKTFIQLVETYPEFAEAWNKRATLYFMMGRYSDSLIDIERVLDLEPRHFGALGGKAMILQSQGKTIEALKVLREELAINPHQESVAQAIKNLLKTSPDI